MNAFRAYRQINLQGNVMRRIIRCGFVAILGGSVAGFSASAGAADLPGMPAKAPAPALAAAPNWSGFYLGGHGGGGWAKFQGDTFADPLHAGFAMCGPCGTSAFGAQSLSASQVSGALGGVHLGYNWQLAPRWIVGVEADWTFSGMKDERNVPLINGINGGLPPGGAVPGSNLNFHSKINSLASIRGRFGVTSGALLAYVTGGVALADIDFQASAVCGPPSCAPGGPFSGGTVAIGATRTGWVVGSGLEWQIPASAWTLRTEYLFYNLAGSDSASSQWTFPGGPFCGPAPCPTVYRFGDVSIHTARVGLSYNFGSVR
jgi:outer membrane immunogenic protein